MVGQGERVGQCDAGGPQGREKALRIADARSGRDARLPGKRRKGTGRVRSDLPDFAWLKPHAHLARGAVAARFGVAARRADIGDHRIDFAQPAGRFAQGAGGQEAAVADAALVLHHDLNIPGQRQVLQSVVRHDHVDLGVGLQQGLHGEGTLGVDGHGRAGGARDQRRLVSEARRFQVAQSHAGMRADLDAIPAADHAGGVAACP
ncbi:hypothetical protein D3C72_1678640 [compost metagenome]